MKRVDLHIHTVATDWDLDFDFDFNQLERHILEWELDAVAITNHNAFELTQYQKIAERLDGKCVVLPGVEASALGTHLLLICSPDMANQLPGMCSALRGYLSDVNDSATLDELTAAFPTLDDFIVIPHYDKKPAISDESFKLIADHVCACETSSLKKALRLNKLQPVNHPFVYFTDYRFGSEAAGGERRAYKPGGIYIKSDSCSFDAIRRALKNNQVALASDGSESLELYPGITATEGINLILGKRSTGKTYTLERICSLCDEDDVYYIKQGDLVSKSKEEAFYNNLENQFAIARKRYMAHVDGLAQGAREVGSDKARTNQIADYLRELKKHAESKTQNDSFSSSRLFNRVKIDRVDCGDGHDIIQAVTTILSSPRYAEALDRIVGRARLIDFLRYVVEETRSREIEEAAIEAANIATNAVKTKLNRSSVDPYPEPTLFRLFEAEAYYEAFCSLIRLCWTERIVSNDQGAHFLKYSVVAERKKFATANDVKKALHLQSSVSLDGIAKKPPRDYINTLLDLENPPQLTDALFNIRIGIRDKRGSIPSGGQRTECVFLGRLSEAESKRVVLIDEPESSFDNPFLDEHISQQIRKLAVGSTVFVTTHNQVLGFGLKPNKVFITSYNETTKTYEIHCGDLGDERLNNSESDGIPTIDSIIQILEAGRDSYDSRHSYYEGERS